MKKIWHWLKNKNGEPIAVLFPSALVVMSVDLFCTLPGQPREYWSDFNRAIEANIIGEWLLKISPYAFVYFFLFYILVTYFLITHSNAKPRTKFALWLSLLLAHSYTAMTWINDILKIWLKNLPKENLSEAAMLLILDVATFCLFVYFIPSKALEKLYMIPNPKSD